MAEVKPIGDTAFWAKRLEDAVKKHGEIHRAVFECTLSRWKAIEERHRFLLMREIRPADRILEVGCGWGRLVNMLPEDWHGDYLGIDLSPDFVQIATENYEESGRISFRCANVLDIDFEQQVWDVAVFVSIRPMIIRNLGGEYWDKIQAHVAPHARKMLFLEYDPEDQGAVERIQ